MMNADQLSLFNSAFAASSALHNLMQRDDITETERAMLKVASEAVWAATQPIWTRVSAAGRQDETITATQVAE